MKLSWARFCCLAVVGATIGVPASAQAIPSPWAPRDRARLGALPVRWAPAPQQTAAASPPAPTAKPAAAAPATRCTEDEACGEGAYCDEGRCVSAERPINILYLFYRSADRRFTELMGFYWHRKGDSGFRVVFPLYWHFWSPQDRARVFFPLYFRFEDRQEQSVSFIIPPLQYRRTPRERNYRLWPLLFWTDYGARGAGLTVLPLFHYSREGPRRSLILPPLLTGFTKNSESGASRGLVGGLYYWYRHGAARTDMLLPLFFSKRRAERSLTWVLPLNFHRRKGDYRALVAFPLLWSFKTGARSWTLNLAPPIFHRRRGNRSWWFAGPIYGASSPESRHFGIIPLLFHRRAASSYTVLFPVVWHFRSPRRSFTLAGPVFHHRAGGTLHSGVFPLWLYRSVNDGRHTQFISPLFLHERDADAEVRQWALVAPPYYRRRDAEREVDTLFPLVWRWHDKVLRTTTWVVPPLVLHNDPVGRTQIAFPLYWRFTDDTSGNATSVLFPLFYRHARGTGTSFNLLFPFYYKNYNPGWSAGIFPLLYTGAAAGRRHAVLFPIFWHLARPGKHTTVLGPLYYQRDAQHGWLAGAAPLLFFGRRDGEEHRVVFPIFWHLRSRTNGYDTMVLGPFFRTKSRKGQLTGLLPLFVTGRWRGASLTTVLPPLLYRRRADNGDGVTWAGLLYYGHREGRRSGFSVLPLFHHRRVDRPGGEPTRVTTLFPLLHYRRGPGFRTLLTPLGGFRHKPAAGIYQAMFGPFIWSRTRESRGFALIPLLFHWQRPAERSTTTVLLPFGVRHVSPKQTAHVLFPIFWRINEPGERNLVVFPLYWRVRRDAGNNADVLFPLVWRLWNKRRSVQVYGPAFWYASGEKRVGGVVPLALYHKNERRSLFAALPAFYYQNDFVERERTWVFGPGYYRRYADGHGWGLFPLLFFKHTAASRYGIVAPVVWHWANKETNTSTTFVGPLFYRRKVDHRAVGLAPLIYAGWDRAGSRTIAALPAFYYDAELGKRALFTPLFGIERSTERKLWYAGTALHVRTPQRSLSGLLPLFFYHRHHVQGSSNLFIFPLYYGAWSAEKSFHLAFPLVWRTRTVDSSATVVFPVYWDVHDRKRSRNTVVFPLVWRRRDEAQRSTSYLAAPGVWVERHRRGTDAVVFPLFWRFKGARRTTTVVFPLYWDFARPQRRTTVAFPVFWRFDREDHTSMVVLNTYYRRDKRRKTYRFHFIPLFDVERRRPGDLRWGVLTGLVGYERVGKNRFLTLFWGMHIKLE